MWRFLVRSHSGEVDFGRTVNRHLAFGFGVHHVGHLVNRASSADAEKIGAQDKTSRGRVVLRGILVAVTTGAG